MNLFSHKKENAPAVIRADKPLEIVSLGKRYSSKSDYAARDISFSAEKGQIVGLLGPNGAGKSTILKCATGMIAPTEGDVFICGYSITLNPVEAKRRLAFVTDNHSVFQKMTGRQYVDFMADVFKVDVSKRAEIIARLDSYFRLGDDIDRLISGYSHGMKQKICMMGSLVHSPDLWILDEPMVGLDPRTQQAVIDFMRNYVKDGKTILFSSHSLETVKKICDRAVVVNHGKIAADVVISECGVDEIDKLYFYDETDDQPCAENGKGIENGEISASENDVITENNAEIKSENITDGSADANGADDNK